MSYISSVITTIAINMLGVLAAYIVSGLGGMFSMGTASFMLIGAYSAGMLSIRLGCGLVIGILAGVVMGIIFALIVAIPVVKLRMDYMGLITFGFGEAIVAFINNSTSLTGGALGLSGIKKEVNLPITLIALALSIWIVRNYSKSKYGRQSVAVKNNDLAAAAMGVNVAATKMVAFVFGGAMAGLAGVLYIYNTTFVDPSGFGWLKTASWIIIVFVGGFESLTGAICTGAVLCALPEVLRSAGELRTIIYCVIVLIIVNFRPQGLFGSAEIDLRKLFRRIHDAKSDRRDE